MQLTKEIVMYRSHVNKGRSAAKFRHNVGRTKVINMRGLMRGGHRL